MECAINEPRLGLLHMYHTTGTLYQRIERERETRTGREREIDKDRQRERYSASDSAQNILLSVCVKS